MYHDRLSMNVCEMPVLMSAVGLLRPHPIQMFCWLPWNSFLNAGLASNPYSKCFVCFLRALFCRQELLKEIRKLNLLYFELLLCRAHTRLSALGQGSEVGSRSPAGAKVVKADARPFEP